MSTNDPTQWIKASASGANGDCVEMRVDADLVMVRDSKDPAGPKLGYTKAEFAAWLDGAKRGEFDHLI